MKLSSIFRLWFLCIVIAHLKPYLPVQAAVQELTWRRMPVNAILLATNAVHQGAVSREIECAGWAKSSSSTLYCFGEGRCIVGLAVDPKAVKGALTPGYLCKVNPGECGGILKAVPGGQQNLTSHQGYGISPYDSNMNCDFLIMAPEGLTVRVQFQSFDTESGYDYLHIHDGSDPSGTVLADLHGIVSPPPFQSSGRYLFLHFKTDASITSTGYSISFQAL